jgi:hypothetical protein
LAGSDITFITTNPILVKVHSEILTKMKTYKRNFTLLRITYTLLISALCGDPALAQLKIDYGKSYLNITKGATGGTIEPGDILEVRATFVVGGSGVNDYVDSCAYFDFIPANTSYIPGSLAILTNEGHVYKTFTDASGDDAGSITGTNVRINLGFRNAPTATATRRGRITYNDKPSFFGATCIMVATFRVQVTGAYGSQVNLGGGAISYYPFGASITSITFPTDSVMIFKNLGICPNSSSNAISSEFGGTFGSGKAKNRTPSSSISNNYTYNVFGPNTPNDYYYNISNNTSTGAAGYTTLNTWAKPDPNIIGFTYSHRVFGVWDIIGDHTGALNPLLGNPATDTVNGIGGYMAVINSSYKPGITFLDTINNLCPNTYYQYSAWFRNICSLCACDSNGKGPGNAGYIPTGPGDSSGVHPNLTFNVNGYDYYTTGDMPYTGQWIKKGFTYLTGPTQTSMIIYVRNNAPGGGGNDWALDDISVASCVPNISLTPNKPDTLCRGSDDTVRFKVSAFFNNYTQWVLQKSIDNGATWTTPGTDTLGLAPSGTATPVFNPLTGLYEYLVTRYYRLNNVDTTIIYRLIIASTAGNLLNSGCNFITSSPKIVRTANCLIILPTQISVKGDLQTGNMARIQWTSLDETGSVIYVVERSNDAGAHFLPLASIAGTANPGMGSSYVYNDVTSITGDTYYRVEIIDHAYHNYSQIILLSTNQIALSISGLVNPFNHLISFNITVPDDNSIQICLFDSYGRKLMSSRQMTFKGMNRVELNEPNTLQTGMYVLQVFYRDQMITKEIIKRIE